ncbi:DNA repair protein RadA [Corynebacterium macginleyi]|uniref:DNA repair protein RadA n=1 Tax=Corynebacterium macginleyi TaxID=38290 RepID=A0A3M0GY28_9CORY|nr:DNA repair protein RadA [Corynebacterium macginleyi]MBK4144292.1 DNA repair protein RadA [Corynebacterium macginleyi]MBK4149853.1 DNA repair protein RadA [Corynebacterium macginleyi]MBK4165566.1 DNA repair protein RadA [Corynebacterium macginleyi]MBK4168705.1 DNA repair protein RadA [Corynebacterium macginleyi]MBK4174928.1 DNA repair protein RadA [Corynebacterium macginleyi]
MAKKSRPIHTCSACGYVSPKWLGRCPDCGSWGTMEEKVAGASVSGGHASLVPTSPVQPITHVGAQTAKTVRTGIGELDRVLGSGIVPGSVVLMAGEPGVGKSTLLLEVASRWAQLDRTVLYATAEESAGQVRARADRTGALHESLYLAAESNLDAVFGHVDAIKPGLIIVDSVQTMQAAGVEGVPGGVAQSRAVTAALTSLAKSTGIPVLLVGHVTKDGNVAGPRVLEHLVDAVLNFEGDRQSSLRMLRGMKNRFGPTDEVGCFEQTAGGIREVADPSGLFLSHRGTTPDGSAVTVAMDGVRPILAEVQALTVDPVAKNPRRVVTGLDANRVPMVLAVLQARAGQRTNDKDAYVATVGGMRIGETATDLAVALATWSSLHEQPLPAKTVVIGEVGLAGELRRVPNIERRLQEAARLGYKRAIVPRGDINSVAGMQVSQVATLGEALAAVQP